MITSAAWAGKRYAVLGLARSGAATVEALLASGARVTAWDSDEGRRDAILPLQGRWQAKPDGGVPPARERDTPPPSLRDGPPPLAGEDLEIADPLSIDLTGFDGVIVSPGVPLNRHPIVAHARAAGLPVIGDIELFAQSRATLPPHKVVGITGTNGKSTTTALIHHILQTAGVPSLMGGNIGLPILSQEPLTPNGSGVGVYVLELSSYQIDLTFSLDCDVAVLTNITPDHLDRYEGFEAYAASKARLFEMQSAGHIAIIAGEDPQTKRISGKLRVARKNPVPPEEIVSGVYLVNEGILEVAAAELQDLSRWPALQGPHNAQNAICAMASCWTIGLKTDQIEAGLRTYPGLPHRMERVAEREGVLYVNDSKATNATATAPALAAYPFIHWILGGRAKSDDLDDCKPHFDHVTAAYTIGEAGPMFARILRATGKKVTESGTLERAVRDAAAVARPGQTVMLSPACASFDQFRDFEARGEAFREAVAGL